MEFALKCWVGQCIVSVFHVSRFSVDPQRFKCRSSFFRWFVFCCWVFLCLFFSLQRCQAYATFSRKLKTFSDFFFELQRLMQNAVISLYFMLI